MQYNIWRHNPWSDVQLEQGAPSSDLAKLNPYLEQINFSTFYFIEK